MKITAHEDLGGRWNLWDGDTYLADCGTGEEGRERAEAVQNALARAVEDNAMLLTALREVDFDYDKLSPRVQRLLDRIREAEHPGRALVAELTRRMTALEQERDAARAYLDYILETYPPISEHEAALRAAYEANR